MHFPPQGAAYAGLGDDLWAKMVPAKEELREEYLSEHPHPWIVGYSGGKDSTLVVHLVFEMLLELPRTARRRPVHIVANDTLVESPLVVAHIKRTFELFNNAAAAFELPIQTAITHPDGEQTFWVNLIGRGYPSPSRNFRWCTDRMKIQPTSRYIREQAGRTGQVILLLGVRRQESAARAKVVKRYDNGTRLNPHNDLTGCMVFRPIVDLTTEDVWGFLGTVPAPWGGSHKDLIALYRSADGGECPVVTSKNDAPSCGTGSSRFGCWTCTVVVKDRSLEGFIESGFAEFGPLVDFRDWLASIRNDPSRRLARRRDGRVTHMADGSLIPGPFTLETRLEILDRVRDVEVRVGRQLISAEEVELIRSIWAEDAARGAEHAVAETRQLSK